MKKLELFYSKILKNNIALFVISVLLFFSLRLPIENILSQTLVKYVLSYIESNWYNDLTFILIVLFLILTTLIKFNKHKPSLFILTSFLVISTIYILYRITDLSWNFTSLSFIKPVKYFDIILIITIQNIALYIANGQKEINSESEFYDDQPLFENQTDLLGYESYANTLSKKLLKSNFKGSFAIGINGKWGLGKTSFIVLMKKCFASEEIIEIDFNPWNSKTPNAIISDFFNSFKEKISPHSSSITNLILNYSNKLIENTDNSLIKSIPNDFFDTNKNDSTYSLYNQINKVLSKLGNKIIVYVDDLDRLDKDEIIEVIRLIRNTANFTNTIFIAAYDRNYIISALKHHNSFKQEEFLEKIFQLEVSLPYFNKDILRHKLAANLKEKLPDIHKDIDDCIIGSGFSVPTYLNEWLDSIRDVTRLSNSIILNICNLVCEVNFGDFLKIELLRLKFPSAYDLLYRKTNSFLDNSSEYDRNNFYKLTKISKEEEDKALVKENDIINKFQLYLYQNHTELSIPLKDIDKIVAYVGNIFSSSKYSIIETKYNPLSIKNPSKFKRYFAYALLEGNLSEIEFSNARSLDQNAFNLKISEWIEKGLANELKNKFQEISTYDNLEDFEKIITAIFHLATSLDKSERIIGYDSEDLVSKITDKKSKNVITQYYNGSKQKYKEFIKNIFLSAKSPYIFESNLIQFINYNLYEFFPISSDELKKICITYFKTYCKENEEMDFNIWNLFHGCKQTSKEDITSNSFTKKTVFPEEAKDILKDFVKNKDTKGFLLSVLESHYGPNKYVVSPIILQIYNSWVNFEKVISSHRMENDFFIEFFEFYDEFAKAGHSKYIDFTFKVINIENKNK